MFGYVKPVVRELLVKENEFYKATYCGICRAMKKHTGALSTVTLTYDSVFLALLRMAYIDDAELSSKMRRCAVHPLKKRCMLSINSATEYTTKAFAVLTYYKLQDDKRDKDSRHRLSKALLRPVASDAMKRSALDGLEKDVQGGLEELSRLEQERCPSADIPAICFGRMLGSVFSHGLEGEGAVVMKQIGFHLGKFIYLADAAEDYERDRLSGSYNPYVIAYGGKEMTEENKRTVKMGLLLECTELESAIGLVPFGRKVTVENIVRNIIYLGLPERIRFLDGKDAEELKKDEVLK